MSDYKLVPVEPTLEMVIAGEDAWDAQLDARLDAKMDGSKFAGYPSEETHALCSRIAYRAMLAAAPQLAEQQPDVTQLVEALESLVKGYVNLLEAGKDRITSLGGDCDPVSVMEHSDPWLRDARAALAAYRKGARNENDQ